LRGLKPGGTLIVDTDTFDKRGLRLAGYETNPLEDGSLAGRHVVCVPVTTLTKTSVTDAGLGRKSAEQNRNLFVLGLVCWLFGRSLKPTLKFIDRKFAGNVAKGACLALQAGWAYGETTELLDHRYVVPPANLKPGRYRNMTGNEALALGLMAAAGLSRKNLFYGAYPITPATSILHHLSSQRFDGLEVFQAEDEIAAISACIGAAFGGAMAVTGSSGPGLALKTEGLGLAVMLELPMLVLNIQRGGPSTGMPTKVEQADLMHSIYGRPGEAPVPVLAAESAGDCFETVIEAWRIATRLMTPVIVLSDVFTANGSEPWRVPEKGDYQPIPVHHPDASTSGEKFHPYTRDALLARPWAVPGTPGLEHRIGGLEKEDGSGDVNYDPENHQRMTDLRIQKVQNAQNLIGDQRVDGPDRGDVLVLSWGGTMGTCRRAVILAREQGLSVAHAHLRHLHPMPANLADILSRYDRILVPELNMGQLSTLIRANYLTDVTQLNKVKGAPFLVAEILQEIKSLAGGGNAA
jgi:2-oxoglutarate ferredoxin oxidoreductase subunit alpha